LSSSDDTTWLTRLSTEEWLRAAEKELGLSEAALRGKRQREGVACARRAAGMALNAVLVLHYDPRYGRSYMEHLQALGGDETVPEPVRAAARALLEAPLGTGLVILGPGSVELVGHATVVVEYARACVAAQPS
jgi:HEPN domain-containing protein